METFNHDGSDPFGMQLEDVQRVTVLGAGNMGHHGIAEVAALAGYDVALGTSKRSSYRVATTRSSGRSASSPRKTGLAKMRQTPRSTAWEAFVDLEDSLADADVVVEVVPEKMAIKKDVYDDEVVEYAPEEAVFVTNTSSLSITELSPRSLTGPSASAACTFQPAGADGLGRGHLRETHLRRHPRTDRGACGVDGKNSGPRPEGQPGFIVNRILVP